MRFAQIRKMDVTNGEGIGISIFTQGCPYHCQGCFNQETWGNKGKEFTQETEDKIIELIQPDYVNHLSILGGEPLLPQNAYDIARLIFQAKKSKPKIKIWLWTGTTLENLLGLVNAEDDKITDETFKSLEWTIPQKEHLEYILNNIDYMIDGRFIQEQRDLTLAWRGSKNQRVLDMPLSIRQRNAVIAEEML